jgi:hypothetical protein
MRTTKLVFDFFKKQTKNSSELFKDNFHVSEISLNPRDPGLARVSAGPMYAAVQFPALLSTGPSDAVPPTSICVDWFSDNEEGTIRS